MAKSHSLPEVPDLFMNFLAHYYVATRLQPASVPHSIYTVGTSLPDLLPLASPRSRLRFPVPGQTASTPIEDFALAAGVRSHLATDTAFHKSLAFAEAQSKAGQFLAEAGFAEIRVRRFFVAHIMVELALDAALLRETPHLGEEFYAAFSTADYGNITLWTEAAIARPLPNLPSVFERFADTRYLLHYLRDEGVAQGLSLLCTRALQDTFEGENFTRLTGVVSQMVEYLHPRIATLLTEAAQPPTIPK